MSTWRFDIQHGPDGETDYAWVYDDTGVLVCTARTHHAAAIVAAMNFLTVPDFEPDATSHPERTA